MKTEGKERGDLLTVVINDDVLRLTALQFIGVAGHEGVEVFVDTVLQHLIGVVFDHRWSGLIHTV